jgi:hypothetical protein
MGTYLVGVGAQEWFGAGGETAEEEEEDGWVGKVASALNEELRRRGLPLYDSVSEAAQFVRGSGLLFEEKLVPRVDGFIALCRTHLSREEEELLAGWTVLVPLSLDEPIRLPVAASCTDESVVGGAPQALALAERLAAAVELPDEVPEACDNLDLTTWFLDGPAKKAAAARPGPWSEDLDAAFYVALYLRAAQFVLRRGCPVVCS